MEDADCQQQATGEKIGLCRHDRWSSRGRDIPKRGQFLCVHRRVGEFGPLQFLVCVLERASGGKVSIDKPHAIALVDVDLVASSPSLFRNDDAADEWDFRKSEGKAAFHFRIRFLAVCAC